MGFGAFTFAQDIYIKSGSSWLVHWQYLLMVTFDFFLKKRASYAQNQHLQTSVFSISHA
jgi:hypothetical protein